MEQLNELISKLNSIIINDAKRQRFQFDIIVGVFSVVAFGMTLLNIATWTFPLGFVTAAFCGLCILNIIIARKNKSGYQLAMVLFAIELIAIFTYFIITGGTDNFSIIWILLMPAIGIGFFGIIKGSVISFTVLIIMLLCFHVPPFYEITTDYGHTFTTRFPIIYVAAYTLAMIMELIRRAYAKENMRLQKEYRYLSMHDALTGMRNRYGYKAYINEIKQGNGVNVAEAIFDIDFFKNLNDTYGHDSGDVVLKDIAGITLNMLPQDAKAFRWGGEEFIIIFQNADTAAEYCESLRGLVESHIFKLDGQSVNVHISIGLAVSDKPASDTDFDTLLTTADDALYAAKESGRNRLVAVNTKDN